MNTLRRFALPLVLLVLLAFASSVLAASGPGPDYKLSDDADFAFTSPDGTIRIEQYVREKDFDIKWQIWLRHGADMTELKPALDYPAGFRFTNDSQWLVRMQKVGAGYQDLFLYHRGKSGFELATKTKISDLAWAYFKSSADGKKVSPPDFHIFAALLKGTEEAYRWLGVTWPDNRYIVISLSGVIEAKNPRNGVKELTGWRCRYDLQNGKFDVPAEFAANNARAIAGKPFPDEETDE